MSKPTDTSSRAVMVLATGNDLENTLINISTAVNKIQICT